MKAGEEIMPRSRNTAYGKWIHYPSLTTNVFTIHTITINQTRKIAVFSFTIV